jgi:hypothetical protein
MNETNWSKHIGQRNDAAQLLPVNAMLEIRLGCDRRQGIRAPSAGR